MDQPIMNPTNSWTGLGDAFAIFASMIETIRFVYVEYFCD
jgi:hypothetical protein